MAHQNASTLGNANRGKIMLFLGLGFAGLIALEIGQAAFGAPDRHDKQNARRPGQRIESIDIPSPPAEAIMTNAPQASSLTDLDAKASELGEAAQQSSPQSLQQSPQQSPQQSKTLAIDSAPADGTSQPNVTTVSPESFAIAAWAGASFPVENFQAYTSPFGFRQSPTGGYRQEFHYGLDIAAPQGSYIRSWWSGKVLEVSDHTNCGTSVIVQSGTWVHIYCHMQGNVETQDGKRYMIDRDAGVQIWEGQEIVAGDRIGRVGMTGRTTGPHLHWGLKYDDNWVDPAWVIRAMSVSQQAMGQQ